jgi:PKD repeat protein
VSKSAAVTGETVNLQVTGVAGARLVSARWSFGDGGTDDNLTTSHSWSAAQTYQVTVTARDAQGRQAVASITVRISPAAVTLPDVVGRTGTEARAQLNGLGLQTAVRRSASDTVPAGTVLGQSPAAGASVAPGTTVNLTVSSGPPPRPATVTLRVVIERVVARGCGDTLDAADFQAHVAIAGRDFTFGPLDNENDASPGWTAQQDLTVAGQSPAAVVISLVDRDDTSADDICDIAPNGGADLNLSIPLVPCSVTGDVSGACGATGRITATGNGEASGDAELTFHVEVT